MMLLCCTVTLGEKKRLDNFIRSLTIALDKTPEYDNNFCLLLTDTGPGTTFSSLYKKLINASLMWNGDLRGLGPKNLVYHRIKHLEEFGVEDNDIIMAYDDDYVFNPYFLKFTTKIFSENKDINFLSLLKPEDFHRHPEWKIEKRSGFGFIRHPSCMGGSSMYRWGAFKEHIYDFFTLYQIDGKSSCGDSTFDQSIWKYIKGRDPNFTFWHLCDFSLVQHCNYGSYWDRDGHTYGASFDPCVNPFGGEE